MKELDLKDIEKFDGTNGNPVYIVHQGKVFDVSESKLWKTGMHMKRHRSGKDLTTDFQAAPHGTEVQERFPRVGIIKKREASQDIRMPAVLSWLLFRFPILRRHPHPMTVHFPIVFMFSATIFNLIYLVTGLRSFETTAFHCLGGGIFFTFITILTGLYTWWLNYLAKPVRAVTIKKRLSPVLLVTAIVAFVWRLLNPEVMVSLQGISYIYLLLILSLLPMVTVLGWFGASMTFPVEKEIID